MTLQVVAHTGSGLEDFIKLGAKMQELAALAHACAERSAPPGALVEATTLAILAEVAGRDVLFAKLSDENFAQAMGMGVASAMMKRGGEVLNLREIIPAFIRGFTYSAQALAAMEPGEPETRQ